jgi:acid phosphatase type 7
VKVARLGLRKRGRSGTLASFVGVAACAAVVAMLFVGSGSAGARASASTFTPVADTYVNADKPSSNFGSQTSLKVDSSPVMNAYLRFDVSLPAGEVVKNATLRLFAASSSTAGFTVHGVASTTWGERTTTFANAPQIGAQVAASGAHAARTYVSVDITPLVTSSGPLSVAVKGLSSSSDTYKSREAGVSNRPQLVVETSPGGGGGGGQTVVFALGDGADGSTTSRDLANYVVAQQPDRFFYLGDVYETGTATEFTGNYEPLYGALGSITDPVIGNHEYANRTTGYYAYWTNKRGWTQEEAKHRSYVDAASGWQIIAYSSETDMVSEGAWVAGEVAKHAGTCRIVMAHRGRHVVVDTEHGDNTDQESVWSQIVGKTAINLVGHNHVYGRLAPISGVSVFVSGAGGHGLRALGTQHHTVAASKTGVATATRFVLRQGAADFTQVDKNGAVYDSGTVTCTPAP